MKKFLMVLVWFGVTALAAAPVMNGLTGVWEVWQLEAEEPPRLTDLFYVFAADGSFSWATPGNLLAGGNYTASADQVALRTEDDPEGIELTVSGPGIMRVTKDAVTVEFRRRTLTREAVEKGLPGRWERIYAEPTGDPAYFVFAADGGWELESLDATVPEEFTGGSYIVDQAGFIVLNDQEGREWVFTMEDGGTSLRGFGGATDFRCRRVTPLGK